MSDLIQASSPVLGRLAKLGLRRAGDLLLHFPLRYEDETCLSVVAEAPHGELVQIEGVVIDVSVKHRSRRQLCVQIRDASGECFLRFLNFYASQHRLFEAACDTARRLRIFGELRLGYDGLEMVHPRWRWVDAEESLPTSLTPVYPTTAGLSQQSLRKLIEAALAKEEMPEFFSVAHHLISFEAAVRYLHHPPVGSSLEDLQSKTAPAWQRIKFDELLAQQLSLRRAWLLRRERLSPVLAGSGKLVQRLLAALPFRLTQAQTRVVTEIRSDLQKNFPMQRLLQGDVGSGKTIVAALAACQAIESGWQVAFMAPTEILAEQHFLKLNAWFEPLGVRVVWLSGRLKKQRKHAAQSETATGAQLVVGTHALIQDAVDFFRLGLTIIDEQHRFGVQQRLALRQKGTGMCEPHQLMMSATPIPRTLAMSYYADLDVSLLDELPPGRRPVRTRLVSEQRRDEVISRVRSAVAEGCQAYWVCPLIEESEVLQLETATETFERLVLALPELRIGLVHGRLKSEEKAETMALFASGKIQVLVATTVIEVGVDVPNACLMVIEHAERFGLAQLHQLRGRVGRGQQESHCILLYSQPLSALAKARLKIIFEHTDGFEIARQDLLLRGPGEFIGSRQSGTPLLRYADLEQDLALIELARTEAERLLLEEPAAVQAHLLRWLGSREETLKA